MAGNIDYNNFLNTNFNNTNNDDKMLSLICCISLIFVICITLILYFTVGGVYANAFLMGIGIVIWIIFTLNSDNNIIIVS